MKEMIPAYLHIAGIRSDNPEWGLQFNLCHASLLGGIGIRSGVDHRLRSVLECRGLGKPTREGLLAFHSALERIIEGLVA